MRFMTKLGLLAIMAATVTAISVSSAMADEIQSHGASFTGHVIPGLVGSSNFVTSAGTVSCDTVTGEGNVENENVPNGVESHVGTISSLDFLDSGHAPTNECDSTISGTTECDPTVNGLPYEVRINEPNNRFHVRDPAPAGALVSFTLNCETFIGNISCTYGTALVSGAIGGPGNTQVAFNQPVPRTSGSFLCPTTGTWQATLTLNAEDGEPVGLAEN